MTFSRGDWVSCDLWDAVVLAVEGETLTVRYEAERTDGTPLWVLTRVSFALTRIVPRSPDVTRRVLAMTGPYGIESAFDTAVLHARLGA